MKPVVDTKWECFRKASAGLKLLAGFIVAGCEAGRAPKATENRLAPTSARVTAVPRVEVGAHGFQPERLALNGNRQIVFRRTSDATCATAVVFPALGIERPLPLNTDVLVDLPTSARGEVGFQCGMGMYKAKVVAE